MKILVGMSGGLDSTYAALKLINEGHDVSGAVAVMHGHTEIEGAREAARALGISLYELDRQKLYDYSSAVAIEQIDLLEKQRFTLSDLKTIIVRLRAPDGCPWDKAQTNDSIKMSAVEEAYELVDAIDKNDDEKIEEETGDVLLQAIFHAVMKEETGAFNLTDVLTGLCKKLIGRHTHVFGKDLAKD